MNPRYRLEIWHQIELDLTGATFFGLDFDRCQLRAARFTNARFIGNVSLREIRFDGTANFKGAQFTSDAAFHEAQFVGEAEFSDARFVGRAVFNDAMFGPASFGKTVFAGQAHFRKTHFTAPTWFHETQFDEAAEFCGARSAGTAGFVVDPSLQATTFKKAIPPELAHLIRLPTADSEPPE